MKRNITAKDVQAAIQDMRTAETTLNAAIYGDMEARRRVQEYKQALEYEYDHDRDPKKIVRLVERLAKAEADKNATSKRRDTATTVHRLSTARDVATMRATAYKKAYLTQCAAEVEAALAADTSWKGMHCHYKRAKEKMQLIIDAATQNMEGITATYSGTKHQYDRDSTPHFSASITLQWRHDYQSNVTITLISYNESDELQEIHSTPMSERMMATATPERIDAEASEYMRAQRDIDALKERYIAECNAITSQFGYISIEDLDNRAITEKYDIRKSRKAA